MLHSASCMEKEDLGAWLGLGIGGGCWSSVQFVDKEQMRGRDHKQAENSKTDNKSARKRRVKDIDARSSSRGPSPSEDADDGGARKKLRLSKEQSTLLENTFRSRNILSHVCLSSSFLSDLFYTSATTSVIITHISCVHVGSEARARAAGEPDAETGGSVVPKQEGQVYIISGLTTCISINFR
jgi:hypothetical protein